MTRSGPMTRRGLALRMPSIAAYRRALSLGRPRGWGVGGVGGGRPPSARLRRVGRHRGGHVSARDTRLRKYCHISQSAMNRRFAASSPRNWRFVRERSPGRFDRGQGDGMRNAKCRPVWSISSVRVSARIHVRCPGRGGPGSAERAFQVRVSRPQGTPFVSIGGSAPRGAARRRVGCSCCCCRLVGRWTRSETESCGTDARGQPRLQAPS